RGGTWVREAVVKQPPVARVTPRRGGGRARGPSPADLAAASPADAVRAWARLGYPRRALALHAAAVAITERHGGVVPDTIDELKALPGVGDYTARAVAVFSHGQRHPVVDINVRRVLARAVDGEGMPGPASTRRDLEAMDAALPRDLADSLVTNAAVMELGALVCTARAPRCDVCPIAALCAWRARGYPDYVGPRTPTQKRFEGSDRQVRGLILAELRQSDVPVAATEIEGVWAADEQRDRALAGLLRDGLVTGSPAAGYTLPGD
ncbi:HhH-GPD family protein, partial [Marisediminicola senii]|uniref:A/G-specific adenine glycosylase n=1 Tax=Marisediminicola senii TaxID=2711233 RepID=UPI0013EA15EA